MSLFNLEIRKSANMRVFGTLVLVCILLITTTGCAPPKITQGLISITIQADGETRTVNVSAGSTVSEAYSAAGIVPGSLDRSIPPLYTVLSDGSSVELFRVEEEFEIQTIVIPYEVQIIQNESIPYGERRLINPGVNGEQEITTRILYENGEEVSRSILETVVIREPIAEIVAVGSQTPGATIPVPGRLVYLSNGNAWMIEDNSSNRTPLITTGDLDGQVFSLSPGGEWLLVSRNSSEEGRINDLWIASTDPNANIFFSTGINNVIHFADWSPTSERTFAVSTVEPRSTAPGWQANNDLIIVTFNTSGSGIRKRTVLDTNSGGVYGWWGSTFAWSPDGNYIAYAQPDSVGLIDLSNRAQNTLLEIVPFNTYSEWAWMPAVSWGPNGNVLYTVNHARQEGETSLEDSPFFDLTAISLIGGAPVSVIQQVGMFAYPVASPEYTLPSGENAFQVAYLQAIFPDQSDSSRAHLCIMDRDGSNPRVIFPPEGAPGLDPQSVEWSPVVESDETSFYLGVIFQGNLWIVNATSGEGHQITGDGATIRIDWD